jgi:hypothetical protein
MEKKDELQVNEALQNPEAICVKSCALIYAALAKARGIYPNIPKNRVATIKSDKAQYSYKYADLSDVFDAIDTVLSENGLTVIQFPSGQNLVTVIGHESGESVTGTWPIKAMKGGDTGAAQAFQAAVQVAKRYALTAMLGISTEETVEGDVNRKLSNIVDPMNGRFEVADGVRMPAGAKFSKEMTPKQNAEEAARAIIAQFLDAKTDKGVNGAWDRNTMFIDVLADKYDELYQNVLDAFSARIETVTPKQDGDAE